MSRHNILVYLVPSPDVPVPAPYAAPSWQDSTETLVSDEPPVHAPFFSASPTANIQNEQSQTSPNTLEPSDSSIASDQPRQAALFVGRADEQPAYSSVNDALEQVKPPESSAESAQPLQAPSFIGPAEQQTVSSTLNDGLQPVTPPESSPESAQPRQAPAFVGPAEQQPAYSTTDGSLERDNPVVPPTLTQGSGSPAPTNQLIEQSTQLPVQLQETPFQAIPWTPNQTRLSVGIAPQSTPATAKTHAEYAVWSSPDYNDIYQTPLASSDAAHQPSSMAQVIPGSSRGDNVVKCYTSLAPHGIVSVPVDVNSPPAAVYHPDVPQRGTGLFF